MKRWSLLEAAGVAVAVGLAAARRTDQLVDPQVWNEDRDLIATFLQHGVRAFAIPVNGYLQLVPRAVTFVSLRAAPLARYPAISTALSLAVCAAFFVFISRARLMIRGGPLLVIAVALVPTDPEVLVVPLYTLWFAGLALFALVLWLPGDESSPWARAAVAVIAGLSNPLVIWLAGAAVLRAVWLRTRREWAVTAAMGAAALVQLVIIAHAPGGAYQAALPPWPTLVLVLCRFLAFPLLMRFGPSPANQVVEIVAAVHGVAILALLIYRRERLHRLLLIGFFLLTALSSIARVSRPQDIHPLLAGPRYFFYPSVFLLWLWIDALLTVRPAAAKLVPAAALALCLCSTSADFNRHHLHLDWARAARELALTGRASFPVERDGMAPPQWTLTLVACGTRYCPVP